MLTEIVELCSQWAVPVIIFVIIVHGYVKGVDLFSTFVEGAKEGLEMAVQILPYLVGFFAAFGVFEASGALSSLLHLARPLTDPLGIPKEILPLAFVRPLSGVASLAIVTDLMEQFGPDSLIGRMAAVMEGSTETTVYVLTVYFASVGIKKIRYSLSVGLLSDLAGFIAAVAITLYFLG